MVSDFLVSLTVVGVYGGGLLQVSTWYEQQAKPLIEQGSFLLAHGLSVKLSPHPCI